MSSKKIYSQMKLEQRNVYYLIWLDILFSVAYDNRYLVRVSKENVLSIGNTAGYR